MTGTKDKLRSLLLAGLMVFSVFAGTVALAGTAAATTSNPQLQSPATDIPVAQQGVTFEHTVKLDNTEDRALKTIRVEIGSADLSDVDNTEFEVKVNGTTVADSTTPSFNQFSSNGDTLTVRLNGNVTVDKSANVAVVVDDVTAPAQEGEYTIRSRLTDVEGSTFASWSNDYTVSEAGTTDDDPPYEAAGNPNGPDGDRNYTERPSGETVWRGQSLFFENASRGAEYELRDAQDGTDDGNIDSTTGVASDISFDVNGRTLIQTSGLSTGLYTIQDGSGNYIHTNAAGEEDTSTTSPTGIRVVSQNFDVEWRNDRRPTGATAQLDVESNRGSYMVTVDADDLSDSELEDIFGNDVSTDGRPDGDGYAGVQFMVDSTEDTIEADLDDIDEDEYTFEFEVADTGVDDSDTLTVGAPEDQNAQFVDNTVVEQRGDVATITMELTNTETAAVVIGDSEDVNYQTTVSLRDTDEDGEVSFDFNTYRAGTWADGVGENYEETVGNVYDANSGTEIVAISRASGNTPGPLEAADYALSAQIGGEEQDFGTLVLRERASTGSKVWTAPDRTTSGDIVEMASPTTTIAQNDYAVVQFNVSGLYGYFDDGTFDEDEMNLQNNPSGDAISPTNFDPDTGYYGDDVGVTLNLRRGGNVNRLGTVFTTADADVMGESDHENDTLYLIVDTEEFETGQYTATFEVNDTNEYIDEEEDVETLQKTFTITERRASFETSNGEVLVESADNQTISGTTNVAPGTTFTVQAQKGGEGAYLKDQRTEVQMGEGANTFSAEFDFSNIESNTTFTAQIPNQGLSNNLRTPGRVGAAPEASVTINNQSTDGSTVTVASASLSDGGFVTIHDASVLEGALFDSVRGTSDYLAAGSHSDIEVSLDTPYEEAGTAIAMPHLDTDGDESYDFVTSEGADDGPYTDDEGNAVVDSATLTIATPTPTAPPTEPPTEPPTTEPPTEPPTTEPPTATPTSGQQPGFGLVVALLALVAAALIAVRRD